MCSLVLNDISTNASQVLLASQLAAQLVCSGRPLPAFLLSHQVYSVSH